MNEKDISDSGGSGRAAVAALAVSIFLNVRKIRLSNKRLAEKQE